MKGECVGLHEVTKLGGAVVFDDLSRLDQSRDVLLGIDDLKEDLFQASFSFEQIIDIGWYPEFCESGCFRVLLVSGCNWGSPVCSTEAKSWAELEGALIDTLKQVKVA